MASDPTNGNARISSLESTVANVVVSLREFREMYERDRTSRGDSGRQYLQTLILVLVPICGMGWMAISGPINANSVRIDATERTLTHLIEREQERNNRIERELGGVMKINELYEKGMLRLD